MKVMQIVFLFKHSIIEERTSLLKMHESKISDSHMIKQIQKRIQTKIKVKIKAESKEIQIN